MVTRTRMFQYKPDGEVTFRMAQDAVGLPAPLMQDPIHYPHGTKFMAPGVRGLRCWTTLREACMGCAPVMTDADWRLPL